MKLTQTSGATLHPKTVEGLDVSDFWATHAGDSNLKHAELLTMCQLQGRKKKKL